MDLHRFAIDGRVIGADDVQLQDALARVYQSPARPRCLCVPGGVEMYVARHRQYVIKRMPDTGDRHHPGCPSFDPDAGALAELLSTLETGKLMQRSVRLQDGAVVQSLAATPATLLANAEQVVNTFGPEYRMLIIGAGQMSEYLATMALFSGFAVTVCDPREEYRSSWSVAGARVVSDMPDDVVSAMRPDRRTCVVALTHDPKLDDLALLQALDTDAFYVGGIGSRRNNAARRARLKEHFEQTDESLARLRGPIGIYIGSKTPPEIAVSVMAEVLAVKNGVVLPRDMEVGEAKQVRERID